MNLIFIFYSIINHGNNNFSYKRFPKWNEEKVYKSEWLRKAGKRPGPLFFVNWPSACTANTFSSQFAASHRRVVNCCLFLRGHQNVNASWLPPVAAFPSASRTIALAMCTNLTRLLHDHRARVFAFLASCPSGPVTSLSALVAFPSPHSVEWHVLWMTWFLRWKSWEIFFLLLLF